MPETNGVPRRYRTASHWALDVLPTQPLAVSRGERVALLVCAAHADAALGSRGGYKATHPSAAGDVTGYATSTMEGFFRKLVNRKLLEWAPAQYQVGCGRSVRIPQAVMESVSG